MNEGLVERAKFTFCLPFQIKFNLFYMKSMKLISNLRKRIINNNKNKKLCVDRTNVYSIYSLHLKASKSLFLT